jgi:hypothetical protein
MSHWLITETVERLLGVCPETTNKTNVSTCIVAITLEKLIAKPRNQTRLLHQVQVC